MIVLTSVLIGIHLEFKPSRRLHVARATGALVAAMLLTVAATVSGDAGLVPDWGQALLMGVLLVVGVMLLDALGQAPERDQEPARRTAAAVAPTVDSLTQLPTRVYFEDRLAAAATKADAGATRLALLFIDLDGFKPVNDTYGHSIGDLVLEQVGQRLKAMSRGKDVVARVGGDEFLLLLTNVTTAEAVAARGDAPDPGPVASLCGRRARGDHLVLGRHRRLSGRLQPCQADRARRRRDVRVQALGRLDPLLLLAGDGRRRGGAVHAPARPAQGDRRQGVRALLPAQDRREERQGHRRRGAAALEASDARHPAAERLHPDRRAVRPDRRDRQLGHRGCLPAKPPVARQGPAHAGGDQPLGAPDAPGRHRRAHHGRAPDPSHPSLAAHLRDHRVGGDGRHEDDADDVPAPGRARHAPLDRRLRHRLLEPELPAQASRPRS